MMDCAPSLQSKLQNKAISVNSATPTVICIVLNKQHWSHKCGCQYIQYNSAPYTHHKLRRWSTSGNTTHTLLPHPLGGRYSTVVLATKATILCRLLFKKMCNQELPLESRLNREEVEKLYNRVVPRRITTIYKWCGCSQSCWLWAHASTQSCCKNWFQQVLAFHSGRVYGYHQICRRGEDSY